MEGPLFWIVFNGVILALLALDLGVLHRRPHAMRFAEAMAWVGFWIGLAVGFGVLVYYWRGPQKALEFATGYLLEESLSVDNLFVFLMLFNYFRVPQKYQHKVLTWGIIGALVMRGLFIVAGVGLIQRFHWIIYVFGAFLIYPTAFKLLQSDQAQVDPERNWGLRLARRMMPIASEYDGERFFTMRNGKRHATLLFVCLIVVETTDVLFAIDSIPAVLAVSSDPFIVYTSNVFAIMGLRSLYFALAGMMQLFHYLHYGLAVILAFVGVKMLISGYYKMPIHWALGTVAGVLALSIIASLLHRPGEKMP